MINPLSIATDGNLTRTPIGLATIGYINVDNLSPIDRNDGRFDDATTLQILDEDKLILRMIMDFMKGISDVFN